MSQNCFQALERQILWNSVVHIPWLKAGFYENLILKTVSPNSELEKFKIQKKKKTKRNQCISGHDQTWGLVRVKPMIYLCANLAVD